MIEEYTLGLTDWIIETPIWVVYVFFFFIAYIENVFPPVPGDLLVVFGGYIAVEQLVSMSMVLGVASFGSVLGFMTYYYIGYKVGDEIRTKSNRLPFLKYLDSKYIDKVELWMYRWGMGVIFANRFLAGTRSIISIVAGISRMHVWKTIIYASLSALIWNFLLLTLGWYIGENWKIIQSYLNYYGTSILIVVGIYILYKIGRYFYSKDKDDKKKTYPEI